jgi:hypothetical protein
MKLHGSNWNKKRGGRDTGWSQEEDSNTKVKPASGCSPRLPFMRTFQATTITTTNSLTPPPHACHLSFPIHPISYPMRLSACSQLVPTMFLAAPQPSLGVQPPMMYQAAQPRPTLYQDDPSPRTCRGEQRRCPDAPTPCPDV